MKSAQAGSFLLEGKQHLAGAAGWLSMHLCTNAHTEVSHQEWALCNPHLLAARPMAEGRLGAVST